jgi:hypothetical protein
MSVMGVKEVHRKGGGVVMYHGKKGLEGVGDGKGWILEVRGMEE